MKIGLRGGHSSIAIGAVGIVDEYSQMQKYFNAVKAVFEQYGHTVIDCNSNGSNAATELSEGATKANNNNVDLFISLHMNCYNGQAHGTEALVSSTSSKAYSYAQNIVNNFEVLGFTNRGVKCEKLYEMNHITAPNIISEICFCDSESDIAIYNKYSWEKLAHVLCNAIDSNIPKEPTSETITNQKGYVVTNYLPHSSKEYDGVDINYILSYFKGVKCYVRGNAKGVWIETQYLDIDKCNELKSVLGNWFYEIKY